LEAKQKSSSLVIVNGVLIDGAKAKGKVKIPSKVNKIAPEAFYSNQEITEVIMPNTVSSIGNGAFIYCWNLTKVTLSNTLKSIGDDAFYGSSLKVLTIPASVTSIGAFAFNKDICKNLVVADNNLFIVNDILIDGSKSEGEVVIPDTVKTIGEYAFYYNKNISKIEIPSSVTNINENAISSCENLETIIIPKTVVTIADNAILNLDATKVTIYGMKKSAAETYAKKLGFKFVTSPK
jgi:hypothetical protein